MAKLILSTGNIISGGPSIVRKPGASNLELVNSLKVSFQDAQLDYADEIENLNANGTTKTTTTTTNGTSNGVHEATNGDSNTTDPVAGPLYWTAQDQKNNTIFVPRIDWETAALSEERSQYDITVKIFFLPTTTPDVSRRAQYTTEAMELVLKELGGIPDVDLLVVSFPGMSFDGDCEWEADKLNASQGDDESEIATWQAAVEELHRQGLVKRLGISEFGTEKLARFIKRVAIPPAVDQINLKNCCNVPPPLATLAKEQNVELLVHSDCTDILPEGTLRELLGPQGARLLADPATGSGGLTGNLTPQWVIKYTAVVKNRGVIENKGYFAGAELN
ncbi:gamma-cysteine synthetase [Neurospora intermedia]|uniref:GCS light chain n=1 Tax=Neurospora intermedia TaxID=5142 RepID=A0ABR3D2C9_NEUIN